MGDCKNAGDTYSMHAKKNSWRDDVDHIALALNHVNGTTHTRSRFASMDEAAATEGDRVEDVEVDGPASADDKIPGSKACTLCNKWRNVLVRCQIDDTNKWHFVCPGKCWTSVSGGEVDAKGQKDQFPYYRYGGMWKNRQADGPLNAKKPKKHKT